MSADDGLKTLAEMEFFCVMNDEGKFFRRKGYGGYGETWVSDPKAARYYTKIGPARGVVTFFANAYPQFPPARLVKFNGGTPTVLDETERVKKVKEAKKRSAAAYAVLVKECQIEEAKRELERAKLMLEKHGVKVS